jgi:DNA repair protein RadC
MSALPNLCVAPFPIAYRASTRQSVCRNIDEKGARRKCGNTTGARLKKGGKAITMRNHRDRAVKKSKAKGEGPQAIQRGASLAVHREVKVITVAGEQFPAHCKRDEMDSPENIAGFWRSTIARSAWYHEDKEHFVCICVDTRYRLKNFSLVSIGSLSEVIAHPREIFRTAVADSAHSIIIAHNHPSGDPSPSRRDIALTRRIYATGELLQIPLLDHIIVGDQAYFSFREDTWPPRASHERRATTAELEELRVEEQALQVTRGGPAIAARKMDHDSLAAGIKEQVDKLKKDPAYMHGPHAEVIAALALELYQRTRKKVGREQK